MSDERLAAAQERLNGIGQQPLGEQADALEFIHATLVAELADLLERKADEGDGRAAEEGHGANGGNGNT